ncbi:hypothetical protein [Rhizobium leguminosarum]|uniref:hypothetical protein n=1 Tax=Rhizobium leguminosarum TaxID=384 RepID=UPI0014425F60|nr:hypothetical protein [Rhizobium leguminosarum]NKK53873.1 hypothetical protein [Rhizobium leguminosarum bv. viciae]
MTATLEEQATAWEIYRLAKVKADSSLSFQDGRAAALAWHVFIALFTGQPARASDLIPHRKVAIFRGNMSAVSEGRPSHER